MTAIEAGRDAPSAQAASFARRAAPLAGAWQWGVLALIAVLYLALAVGWARATPPWDNPDEPAHWNYVRYVAQTGTLPVLRPGDYPQQEVERLKSARFPPGSNVDAIRYESHQPPLYYALAAVAYKLTAGMSLVRQVEAIRLLSALFGLLTIGVSWRIARGLLPAEPALALATAAFVAFVPMHVNMTAAIDNDALGDLLLATTVLGLLRFVQRGLGVRGAIVVGLPMGLAVLTKVTTLIVFPLALFAALLHLWRAGRNDKLHPLLALGLSCLAAVAVWGWWVVRNLLTYGPGDPLALRINGLVVSQPGTGPLTPATAWRFVTISFDSFWAQFGWMGIPVPQVYPPLTLLSVLAAFGLVVALLRGLRPGWTASVQGKATEVALVLAWPLLVAAGDVEYNLTFLQAQGRYLFPAIGGIGLFFMLGLSRLAGPRLSALALAATSLLFFLLCVVLLEAVVIPAWR